MGGGCSGAHGKGRNWPAWRMGPVKISMGCLPCQAKKFIGFLALHGVQDPMEEASLVLIPTQASSFLGNTELFKEAHCMACAVTHEKRTSKTSITFLEPAGYSGCHFGAWKLMVVLSGLLLLICHTQ